MEVALLKLISRKLAAMLIGGLITIVLKAIGCDAGVMMTWLAVTGAAIGGQSMIDHMEAKKAE